MSNFESDMAAYRITDSQKESMRRLVKDKPEADLLLRMLGVIEEEVVVVRKSRTVNVVCDKHKTNKHRRSNGKLVCRKCDQERARNRSK